MIDQVNGPRGDRSRYTTRRGHPALGYLARVTFEAVAFPGATPRHLMLTPSSTARAR